MQQATIAPAVPEHTPVDTLTPAERLMELRAIAQSALLVGPDGVSMWRCFAELKGLAVPKQMRAEYLEARIGICVAARIRPSMTLRAIKELRDLRQSRGESAEFDAFESRIKTSLGATRLTNHGYQAANFSDMDHTPVWDTVSQHIQTLQDREYQVFLNSGTLLGVVRDERLIDHDDDIDLAVILKSETAADAAAEWTELVAEIRTLGLLDEAAFNDPAIIKLSPIGAVQVDLFPCWLEGDKVFVYPHTSGQLTRADVLPLAKCPITGNPVPADAGKMLAVNYGNGWQTPDPYFKFEWTRARKTFAHFLKGLT